MALSARQRKLLDTAMEPGISRSITAVCEASDVTRQTFYRWLDNDEFRQAWESVWYGSIRRHLPGVVAAMIDKAQGGDVQAARLVADMAGVMKQHVETSGTQTIRVVYGKRGDGSTDGVSAGPNTASG